MFAHCVGRYYEVDTADSAPEALLCNRLSPHLARYSPMHSCVLIAHTPRQLIALLALHNSTCTDQAYIVSRWDRLLIFGALNLGALAIFVICFTLFPILSLKPRKFAILYVHISFPVLALASYSSQDGGVENAYIESSCHRQIVQQHPDQHNIQQDISTSLHRSLALESACRSTPPPGGMALHNRSKSIMRPLGRSLDCISLRLSQLETLSSSIRHPNILILCCTCLSTSADQYLIFP